MSHQFALSYGITGQGPLIGWLKGKNDVSFRYSASFKLANEIKVSGVFLNPNFTIPNVKMKNRIVNPFSILPADR